MDAPDTDTRMLTIVWDVDDVLNDLTRRWLEWEQGRGRHTETRYEDLTSNPPYGVLGVSLETYLASLDEFRLSEDARGQAPVPEVMAWFREHGSRFHHVALTATPVATAPTSAEWVVRTYGTWIRTFHFAPSPRPGDGVADRETKTAAVLRLGGADAVVDDMPGNLEGLADAGIPAVLFPRPWNAAPGTAADALDALTKLMSAEERA